MLAAVNECNRTLAASIVGSDLKVYLTPITFGGYSSALKRMVDHEIQNIAPFFVRVEGETHHRRRYERYPDFLAVGWADEADADVEAVFRHLVGRNAINFHARRSVAGVITGQPAACASTMAMPKSSCEALTKARARLRHWATTRSDW